MGRAEQCRYKLSEHVIAKLPAHEASSRSAEKEWCDSECIGLRLVVAKTGRKKWDFRYRMRGRKQSVRLGEWPAVTTGEARRRANEAKAKVSLGVNPLDERRAAEKVPTLEEFVLDEYMPHARKTIKSWADSETRLKKWVLPALGSKRLCDVTKGDVQRLYERLTDELKVSSANRTVAALQAAFSHAVRIDAVDRNPVTGIRKAKENNQRNRCLSDDELKRYLAALAQEPNAVMRCFLRLLLSTGMRRGEAMAARWEHVDMERRTLHLPETKAGKSRTVLLNDAALAALREVPRVDGNPNVFPAEAKDGHIAEPSSAHKRACERAGIANLRMHDLRHSFASLAVSAGASLYVVQNLLGHASPQMTQRYTHLNAAVARQGSQTVSDALRAASQLSPPPGVETKPTTAALLSAPANAGNEPAEPSNSSTAAA